jgi:hypothetical protein
MFDVKIVMTARLGNPTPSLKKLDAKYPPFEAVTHVTLREGATFKRWHVHGKHDRHLPGTGEKWLTYKRSPENNNHIILLNKHGHEWAVLWNFPLIPHATSKGTALFSNLIDYPAYNYNGSHNWFGDWKVSTSEKQVNLPMIDAEDTSFLGALLACERDTGWRFETSSGGGLSAGIIAGGGAQMVDIVLKRKEPNDVRRWDLKISAAGIGLMTPGVGRKPGGGISGSTEDFTNFALDSVRAGSAGNNPFRIDDFAGYVCFCELAASFGVAAGVGISGTTFMFIDGMNDKLAIPNPTALKAILHVAATSAGLSKASTPKLSASASGMMYGGTCSIKLRA